MNCPKCNGKQKCTDTRHHKDGTLTRRRRQCLVCNYRWSTYEYIAQGSKPTPMPKIILERILEHARIITDNVDQLKNQPHS